MAPEPTTLIVSGASGHLGRRVLELLLEQGVSDRLVAVTRTPDRLTELTNRAVEIRAGDFDRPDTLATAFAGGTRLLLISTDVAGEPGRRERQHRNAVEAAQKAGIQHVVYTSFVKPEPGTPITLSADHYATEQALTASTLDWTVLRDNMYAQALLGSLPRAIESGTLIAAAGDGRAAFVTREDCARVAAAVLASDRSGRAVFDVTGPEAVSHAEIAQIASAVSGKSVTYVPVSAGDLIAGMKQAGLPPFVAELIASFDIATARGDLADVSTTVVDLTGTPPQSLREFLAANLKA